MKKKLLSLILSIGMVSSVLVGCGGTDNVDSASDEGVEQVLIGCWDGWTNVSYIDENGELTGFEIELLKRIDEELDAYEFEFEPSSANFLTLIDTGKLDMASSLYTYTEERAEKYLFTTVGYRDMNQYITCLEGNDYTTLESLAGKTMGLGFENDSTSTIMKAYNEANPDKAVELDYFGDSEIDIQVQGVLEGRWDALTGSITSIGQLNEISDVEFIMGDIVEESEAYWILAKDEKHEQLRDAIDEVLTQLKESGELNELHLKWFGAAAYNE